MTGREVTRSEEVALWHWMSHHPHDRGIRMMSNAWALWISNLLSKLMLLAWQIVLARLMGVQEYGIYGAIGSLLLIGSVVSDLGTGIVVIREVAKRPKMAGKYLAGTLRLQPLLALLGYLLLLCTAALLGYTMEVILLLSLAGLSLFVDVLGNMAHNQFIAAEEMLVPSILGIAHVGLLLVLATGALVLGTNLWGFYIAVLAAGAVRALMYWLLLIRRGVRLSYQAGHTFLSQLVTGGLPIAGAAILLMASTQLHKLLMLSLTSPESTGVLTAAFLFVFGMEEFLLTPWLVATLPWMSQSNSKGESGIFQALVEKLAFWNLSISVPSAMALSLVSEPLLRVVFGIQFSAGAGILQILVWYTVVKMVGAIFAQVLIVKNRQRRLLTARAVSLVLNVTLALSFIPLMGGRGAAFAALLSELPAVALFAVSSSMPKGWWRGVGNRLWRLVVSGIVSAAVALGLRSLSLVLALLSGAITYSILLLLTRAIKANELRLLWHMLQNLPKASQIGRQYSGESL